MSKNNYIIHPGANWISWDPENLIVTLHSRALMVELKKWDLLAGPCCSCLEEFKIIDMIHVEHEKIALKHTCNKNEMLIRDYLCKKCNLENQTLVEANTFVVDK